jgi:hypothetical protein
MSHLLCKYCGKEWEAVLWNESKPPPCPSCKETKAIKVRKVSKHNKYYEEERERREENSIPDFED